MAVKSVRTAGFSRRPGMHCPKTMAAPHRGPFWVFILLSGCLCLQLGAGFWRAGSYPLSGDEALYAYWARHWLENRDPLFLAHWIDKPPLYIWLQTLVFRLFGPAQDVARYVNIAAIPLLSAVLYRFAARTWGLRAGIAAVLMASLHPCLLAYAPTGLTDPVLILLGTASFLLAWEGKCRASGLALALAICTKQSGVFYLPLVAGTILIRQPPAEARPWRNWGLGLAMAALPIQLWDAARWAWAPSFWALGFEHYAPLRLLPVSDWAERGQAWLPLCASLWGSWPGGAGWAILLGLAARTARAVSGTQTDRLVGWMLGWAAGYVLVHAGMSFNAWDRYLLPLVPAVILGTVWALEKLAADTDPKWHQWSGGLALCMLVLALAGSLPSAWQGTRPGIAQFNQQLSGLPEALERLAAQAPEGAVLFHHELSWPYLFYLFGNTALVRVWYGDADHLVREVQARPARLPKFQLRLDADQDQTARIAARLSEAGWLHVPCYRIARVSVYEIRDSGGSGCQYLAGMP